MVESGGCYKTQMEYAEMCKTIKKDAKGDIRKYNQDIIIRETILTSMNLWKVRRTQTLNQARQFGYSSRQAWKSMVKIRS